jgi:hypothetical protein
MNERYFAKVVNIQDKFTVVINAGSERDVKVGMKFLIVGLGDLITDPDTNEEIERLELVRGRAEVVHVQEKLSTLRSVEVERQPDTREIKKVTSRSTGIAAFIGPQDVVTESITPSDPVLLEFRGVKVSDFAIKL